MTSQPPSDTQTRLAARIGGRVGSPGLLAVIIAILVGAPGTMATLSAYANLKDAEEGAVDTWINTRAEALGTSLRGAFGIADGVIRHVEMVARTRDPSLPHGGLFPGLAGPDDVPPGGDVDERGVFRTARSSASS